MKKNIYFCIHQEMFSEVPKLRNSQLPDSHRPVLTCQRVDFHKSGNPVSGIQH